MNTTATAPVEAQLRCAICGEPIVDEEWYFGQVWPDDPVEGYAHARCA